MDFNDLEIRARAATEAPERHTIFAALCQAVEADPELVERVREVTARWPASHRHAPAYTIHRLVDGRLPSAAASFLGGLRLFDLVLDESTGAPADDDDHVRPFAAQFEALRDWVGDLPEDLASSIEHLDWSYTAWRQSGMDPFDYVDEPPGLDFRALDREIVLAVLRSPLCARLRTLNLSKGPWLVESLTIESDHDAAEGIMAGFMGRIEWADLMSLPCAKTLEALALAGTDVRIGDLDHDEGDVDFRYPADAAPFPELRHLDVSVGRANPVGDVLYRLVDRGAMPKLETIVAVDNLSPKILAARAQAEDSGDDEAREWIDSHFFVRTMEAVNLAEVASQPGALRRVAFGAALDLVRADVESEGIELPEQLGLVDDIEPPSDLVVPWIP
jgi:hypothetical protein